MKSKFAEKINALSLERKLHFLKALPYYLAENNEKDRLRILLGLYDFLKAKLEFLYPIDLISDYDLLSKDDDLQLVQESLKLCSHILENDRTQLAGQLLGRLLTCKSSEIKKLTEQAKELQDRMWLQPITCSLICPRGPLLFNLEGHSDAVIAVTTTPNGKNIISASKDNTLKVWDIESGELINTLKGFKEHTEPRFRTTYRSITGLVVTPDSKNVISTCDKNNLKIWEIKTGKSTVRLEGHKKGVTALNVSPDGLNAITASNDGTIKIWNMDDGHCLHNLRSQQERVNCIFIENDIIISVSEESFIGTWNLNEGLEPIYYEGHKGRLLNLSLTEKGPIGISAVNDGIDAWTWSKDFQETITLLSKKAFSNFPGVENCVALTLDGRRIIFPSSESSLTLWDLDSGKSIYTLEHSKWITGITITNDGRRAISCSEDWTARVWNLEWEPSKIIQEPKRHTEWINAVAVTPNGKRGTIAFSDGTIQILNLENGNILYSIKDHNGYVTERAFAISPDGRFAVTGSYDKKVNVYDIERGKVLHSLKEHDYVVYCVEVTQDGSRVISGAGDRTLKVWDILTGELLANLEGHHMSVTHIAALKDNKRVISTDDRTLKVWNIDNGRNIHTIDIIEDNGASEVTIISATPDGSFSIIGFVTGKIMVVDIISGKKLYSIYAHKDRINGIVTLEEKQRYITVSKDGFLKIRYLKNGKLILKIKAHDQEIWDISKTLDERFIISASADRRIKIWDLKLNTVAHTFTADFTIRSCAISKDGKTILAGDRSGRIHILRLRRYNQINLNQ